MSEIEIPSTPLRVSVTSLGWMPDVALHRHRRTYIHESSYASLVLAAFLFALAFLCSFLPWNEPNLFGTIPPAKYVFSLLFICGSVCSGAVFFIRNHFGQRLIIDKRTRTVTLQKTRAEAVLHWLIGRVDVADRLRHGKPVLEFERKTKPEAVIVLDFVDVVGIQICGGPPAAYQVNLVFRTSSGGLDRDCLANHVVKQFCTNLAQRYSKEFGFKVIDNIANAAERGLATNRLGTLKPG